MSNTKGSMLISNANAVGTELVNQLGGTGYKPSEWSDAINLLGISDDDKASALAGITEGTYTGTDRGAIKYSNCNAVGAMLNKKFSTNRGFKPVEWESAISKLIPLAEGTVSGAICNIVNGADDVPIKSVIAHIAPTLTGKNAVSMKKAGKNLSSGGVYEYSARNMIIAPVYLKAGTYTVSFNRGVNVQYIYIRKGETVSLVGDAYATKSNSTFFTFTADEDAYYYAQLYRTNTSDTWEDYPVTQPQIEVGSTATAYVPYVAPTTYTANLGRTVYGGQADIVTGEGIEEREKVEFDGSNDENWSLAATGTYRYNFVSQNFIKTNTMYTDILCDTIEVKNTSENVDGGITCRGTNYSSRRFYIFFPISNSEGVNDLTTFKAWLSNNPCNIVYAPTTPTDFTFTPITPTPETALGVNNFWSDNGDSTITYRKDPDIPDPPVQLLNMNNNNEDNNEGV